MMTLNATMVYEPCTQMSTLRENEKTDQLQKHGKIYYPSFAFNFLIYKMHSKDTQVYHYHSPACGVSLPVVILGG